MNVTVAINFIHRITRTFSAAERPGSSSLARSGGAFDANLSLSATSTPPVTKSWTKQLTGSQNLDLTNLVHEEGDTVDASGLKLQSLRVHNNSVANTVTVDDGVTNAYQLNGGDAYLVPAGGDLMVAFNDKLADVDATHKNLAITATAGQTYNIEMTFG
jgi:hypothetical protein